MKILLVEDSPTDRELLKYLLEARFQEQAKFREASTLETAIHYLDRGDIDCVILDLNLPDSVGKETFTKIAKRYPHIPVIIMTASKDRDLAIDMIRDGAADYIVKNFTDEEELFSRVMFAIEKAKTSVRCSEPEAAAVKRMDSIRTQMLTAHKSGEHQAVRDLNPEALSAVTDVTKRTFAAILEMNIKLATIDTRQEHMAGTVDNLETEIRGGPTRQSYNSQLNIHNRRLDEIEERIGKDEDRESQMDAAERTGHFHIKAARISGRTKIIVAAISLIGVLAGAGATWYITMHKPNMEHAQ